MYQEILAILPYLPIALLGMAIHIMREKIKQKSKTSLWAFLMASKDRTTLTAMVVLGAVYLAFTMEQLNGAAAFFLGYSGDNLLNKWDKKVEGKGETNGK